MSNDWNESTSRWEIFAGLAPHVIRSVPRLQQKTSPQSNLRRARRSSADKTSSRISKNYCDRTALACCRNSKRVEPSKIRLDSATRRMRPYAAVAYAVTQQNYCLNIPNWKRVQFSVAVVPKQYERWRKWQLEITSKVIIGDMSPLWLYCGVRRCRRRRRRHRRL